jgi:tetraacyldisaccharide 4'-kinase
MRLRRLLLPLNPIYRLGLGWRERRLRSGREPVNRLRFPVVSVGNLSMGGAGKTPFAIALARALTGRGFAVDVLSRGYGRRSEAPTRVRLDGSVEEFGDEPLVIAHQAVVPVYVARQRHEAGMLAEAYADQNPSDLRPRVHILDDGFQHRQLYRDVDILLLNREDCNDRLLPGGNLRESRNAIHRAGVIGIPDDEPELEDELRRWGWKGPVWRLHRRMDVPAVEGPVLAFCGIARPEQFFAGLEAAGLRIARRMVFRDHYRYGDRDLVRLEETARATAATALVTTVKDQVRFERDSVPTELPFLAAGLKVEIRDEAAALDWLEERVRDIPRR